MRLLVVQRLVGALVALSGVIMLPPAAISAWYADGIVSAFLDSALACAVVGGLMWLPVRRARHELRVRDGFLVTVATWVMVCLACALPFMLGPTKLPLSQAVFESVSGLTTTGVTVLVGLDRLPASLLFYRQSLCFIGGMGIVIIAVAIVPMLRIGGSQLFRAEASSGMKDTRLTPRIAGTARALWFVYLGLNALCALSYWIAGMDPLDAIGHAFSTVATSGFSTHDASLGYFHNALVETIAMVFMTFGGVSFALHYAAWRRASAQAYFSDAELRAYFVILMCVTVLLAAAVYAGDTTASPGNALRRALFQAISHLTTTGYFVGDFAPWPSFAPMLLLLVPFIGACSGSTSGGLKVVRVLLLFKQGAREVQQLIHPRGRFMVKLGGLSVSGAVLAAVTGFCTLYALSFVAMALVLAAAGVAPADAWTAVATCINNMGPGIAGMDGHYADLGPAAVWVLSVAMLLGRLEVFTVLVLLSGAFWRD